MAVKKAKAKKTVSKKKSIAAAGKQAPKPIAETTRADRKSWTAKQYKDIYRDVITYDYDFRLELLLEALSDFKVVLSFSALKAFSKSPREFITYMLKERKTTPAMEFGNLVDCLLLTPDDFETTYYIKDFKIPSSAQEKNFAEQVATGMKPFDAYCLNYKVNDTEAAVEKAVILAEEKAAKLEKFIAYHKQGYEAQQFAEKHGKKHTPLKLVSREDYEHAKSIVFLIMHNRASGPIMHQITATQVELEWTYMGFRFRGFVDGDGETIMMDMKMMGQSAEPRKAKWTIADMKYPWQAAFYLDASGKPNRPYYIVAADMSINVSVTEIVPMQIREARREIEQTMRKFLNCIANHDWFASYEYHNNEFEDGIFRG